MNNPPTTTQQPKAQPQHQYHLSFSPHQQHLRLLKSFTLKKSIFSPDQQLSQIYSARRHIPASSTPEIDILYSTTRWLLLETPKYHHSFFKKLQHKKMCNPYQEIARVFHFFTALTKQYGFFRPTQGMIFLDSRSVRVWIHEDPFEIEPMMALGEGKQGEKQYILAFLAMIESNMGGWQCVGNIGSIEQAIQLLEGKINQANNSLNGMLTKRLDLMSGESIIARQYEYGKFSAKILAPRAIQSYCQNHHQPINQINPPHKNTQPINQSHNNNIHQHTNHQFQGINYSKENLQGLSNTHKKFALTSTSTTLEKFSYECQTDDKKKNTNEKNQQNYTVEPSCQPQVSHTERKSIEAELQDLFWSQCTGQDNYLALEKIAEEMQQVLTW